MRQATATLALIALVLPAGLAQAEDTTRYRLERTDDGYVRMDTETGAMSICKERGEQLVCRLAADAQSAFDDEAAALQKRIDALEDRVAALEKELGARVSSALPSDEEVDKTLGIMERFFRRFMDMVQDFEKQADENKQEGTQQPGRT